MKKRYEPLEIEIIRFTSEDIITASGEANDTATESGGRTKDGLVYSGEGNIWSDSNGVGYIEHDDGLWYPL